MSYDDWNNLVPFDRLQGRTLVAIVGAEAGSGEITFVTAEGDRFVQYHEQDCCESVGVEEVVGDVESILHQPILSASEDSNGDGPKPDEWSESWTWTFYTLRTNRGTLTIRWLGESNGYYGESVDTYLRAAPEATS